MIEILCILILSTFKKKLIRIFGFSFFFKASDFFFLIGKTILYNLQLKFNNSNLNLEKIARGLFVSEYCAKNILNSCSKTGGIQHHLGPKEPKNLQNASKVLFFVT